MKFEDYCMVSADLERSYVTCLKVLFRHSSGETEENHKNLSYCGRQHCRNVNRVPPG
jgi:hypothetical protein